MEKILKRGLPQIKKQIKVLKVIPMMKLEFKVWVFEFFFQITHVTMIDYNCKPKLRFIKKFNCGIIQKYLQKIKN